tara:strand:+ start:144 stop:1178 length:1035 start_codon:yes stop_codon:yes gene_type:complete
MSFAHFENVSKCAYRAAASLKHARTITIEDLRAEVSDFLKQYYHGMENNAAIQEYLDRHFGLWNPEKSLPFKLRRGDKETDQCLSLQAVIMNWLIFEKESVYYMGAKKLQLKAGEVTNEQVLKITDLPNITLGTNKFQLKDYQHTAIKAWQGNWWVNLDEQITYNSQNGPILLIRKYTCPEYDPENNPTGTGIMDSITQSTIEDSFDVFSYKTSSDTPPREMCYAKTSLGQWLKDKDTWPNTGERIPADELIEIRRQLGVSPPIIGEGGIRCGWFDDQSMGLYRVVLTRDQVHTVNGWQLRLPRHHSSAGHLDRAFDWDFDTAQDIPATGPVRDRHNSNLTRFD